MHQCSAEQWDQLIASIESGKQHRAEMMPTEQDALQVMNKAIERLKELGWREAMYAPKDGRVLEFIEAGSTGIHKGHCDEKYTWLHDAGDLWPSKPILFREPVKQTLPIPTPTPAQQKFLDGLTRKSEASQ